MEFLRIPPRYKSATLASFEAKDEKQERVKDVVSRYVATFQDRLAEGVGMIFTGSAGTGKTHLGYALCRALAERGHTVVFTTAPKVIRNIRSGRRYDAEITEQQLIDFYAGVDLLVVDEIGVGLSGDSDRSILFDLISERYNKLLPTVVITNLNSSELPDALGPSCVDRLMHGGISLSFAWDSHRV